MSVARDLSITEDEVSRTRLNATDQVSVMENHDAAYHIWRRAGTNNRILIHIDAHHDMWWIPDSEPITIANFICAALRNDQVREVFWVVPDPTWETEKTRRPLLRHLERITKKYPEPCQTPEVGESRISTVVLGKPLRVCPLRSLPAIDESVLLDIDVDFFLIPRVAYGERDKHGALPWCWPEDLLARLRASHIRFDLVTIVYSVEGGYTPLKWKYLGDELALRIKGADHDRSVIQGLALLREAAVAADRGDLLPAEEKYLEAGNLLPNSPAPLYHLAHLYIEMGRLGDGQKCYQQALLLDPSYRTAYNSAALRSYRNGRFRQAEQEYRRTLELDPHDGYAHFGLGRLAARRKRWNEAEASLRKSLALESDLPDAHRTLGDVLAGQGLRKEAIAAYQRSLQLALAGHKPLEAPIMTYAEEDRRPRDPGHCRTYARLARLYALEGGATQAISSYRISIAGGHDGALLRSRLAHLYLKQNQRQKAGQEAWQAVKMIPMDLKRAGRRLGSRLRMR